MHIIWFRVYMSVYGKVGVLNFETVYYLSSLFGIWYTHIMKICVKQVPGYVGLSDDGWSILILVGVRQMKVW
jgi:hypothetical protein